MLQRALRRAGSERARAEAAHLPRQRSKRCSRRSRVGCEGGSATLTRALVSTCNWRAQTHKPAWRRNRCDGASPVKPLPSGAKLRPHLARILRTCGPHSTAQRLWAHHRHCHQLIVHQLPQLLSQRGHRFRVSPAVVLCTTRSAQRESRVTAGRGSSEAPIGRPCRNTGSNGGMDENRTRAPYPLETNKPCRI